MRGLNVWRSIRPLRRPVQVSSPVSAGPLMTSWPARSARLTGAPRRGEIGRRSDEEAPRALELSGDETRIRKVADTQRKVGPFGDQILVAIRHHEIDLEQRMPGEERRQQRHDAPHAIFGRQGDAQHAGETVGAARRALRLVDREQGVARASQQRLAGVGGGNLPGGADEELDAQAALERRDGRATPRAGRGRIRARPWKSFRSRPCVRTRRAAAADHSYGDEYIISLLAQYLSPAALPTSWPSKPPAPIRRAGKG